MQNMIDINQVCALFRVEGVDLRLNECQPLGGMLHLES